jgi:stage II sporulation protein D
MKRIGWILVALTLVCFIIPIIFTIQFRSKEASSSNIEAGVTIMPFEEYNYKDYNVVKIYHTKTNTIEEMSLDTYLYGVVAAEMPATYSDEALNAQAVVARTYTLYSITNSKNKHGEAHLCDDSGCCQAWISKEDRFARWEESERENNWAKVVNAVNRTQGKLITYQGKAIDALFHSNSGGVTESPINVWGGSSYPYLQSVATVGEEQYTQYSSEVILTTEELLEKLKVNHANIEINFAEPNAIEVTERTESGRIKTIRFGNVSLSRSGNKNYFWIEVCKLCCIYGRRPC